MPRRYTSAGAIVTTADLTQPAILLLDQVRATGQRQTVAPKGRLEPGETPLHAALREVTEESGATGLRYGAYLGQQAYTFTDNDTTPASKTVDWFLFTTARTTLTPATDEGFTAATWHDATAARQAASHAPFRDILDRALAVIAWRAAAPLPFSAALDATIRQISTETASIIATHPGAGLGLCGSAARGDFIDNWSDIDFIAWNLPDTAAAQLTTLIGHIAERHHQRASLHIASTGTSASQPPHDKKAHTALCRIGIDTAIIAGTAPTPPSAPTPTDPHADLDLLRAFTATRLATPATTETERFDTTRRVLAALANAARQTITHQAIAHQAATHRESPKSLRLPDLADTLDKHWPGSAASRLLRDYDAYRRAGAHHLATAEQLATQVPAAIDELTQHLTTT